MSSRVAFKPIALALLLCAGAATALAQPAAEPTRHELRLTALGGAALSIPAWKEVRRDAGIAVFEQLPEPATQKPYYVLMCTLEEGPPKDLPIAWDKVRDNIIKAASKNGRTLTLDLKDSYTGAATFEARRLVGQLASASPEKKVDIELFALVKDGKLLTIGLVADGLTPATTEILQGVARSARLGP